MDALLVTLFDDAARARDGAALLHALHAEGALSLYALAVVARAPRGGGVVVGEPVSAGRSTAAPAVGAAVGALVTLLGGAVTAATRTLDGGLVGAVHDLGEAGLDSRLLARIARDLPRGGAAVIAEVEEWIPPRADAQVAGLGGRAFRHHLAGALVVEGITREVEALRRELADLRAPPRDGRQASTPGGLLRDRAAELRRAVRRGAALAAALRREGTAKVAVLREQAERLEGEARASVEGRAATVRASLEARAARLDRVAGSA
jgi:uncharacterized membrane protein